MVTLMDRYGYPDAYQAITEVVRGLLGGGGGGRRKEEMGGGRGTIG